ncbi:MAG: type II toxin-antitoxin system Phd/YefM family antitoxin [Galactobacter sp.]
METVKVQYAKTHLSALLARVEQGEEIIIARGNTQVARLSPTVAPAQRELGFVDFQVPDTFFDELPDTELTAWESSADL